ncbi:conserved hypothetical protein [Brucella anthropi ATCC 49188]|uniref:BrnT family toxin n=3 Tax=Brucella/Ochrobactrum group TaxID=2826938 RepID=A6WWJ2_BRUA4|nr:conserved hypothetical protein [Brucella anthropi ATCC 49188]
MTMSQSVEFMLLKTQWYLSRNWIRAKWKTGSNSIETQHLHLEFFLSAKVFPTKADRLMAIGEFNGQIIIVVVFKPIGSEALSVISMRPASQKERKL